MKTIFTGALYCVSLLAAGCTGGYIPSRDDRIHAELDAQCTALGNAYYSGATKSKIPLGASTQDAVIAGNAIVAELNAKQRAYQQCEADLLRLDQMQADEAQRRLQAYRAMEAQFRETSFQPQMSTDKDQSDPRTPPQAPTDAVSGYEPPPKPQPGCIGVVPVPTIVIATPCPTQ